MNISADPGTTAALQGQLGIIQNIREQAEVALAKERELAREMRNLELAPSTNGTGRNEFDEQLSLTLQGSAVKTKLTAFDRVLEQRARDLQNIDLQPSTRDAQNVGFGAFRIAPNEDRIALTKYDRIIRGEVKRDLRDELAQMRKDITAKERSIEDVSAGGLGRSMAGSADFLRKLIGGRANEIAIRDIKDVTELGQYMADAANKKWLASMFDSVGKAAMAAGPAMAIARQIKELYSSILDSAYSKVAQIDSQVQSGDKMFKAVFGSRMNAEDADKARVERRMQEREGEIRNYLRDSRADVDERMKQGAERYENLMQGLVAANSNPSMFARLLYVKSGGVESAPETRRSLEAYLLSLATQQNRSESDARQRDIQVVQQQIQQVLDEMKTIKEREDAQAVEAETKGDERVNGVRKAVLWQQESYAIRAAEEDRMRRRMDWNPY